MSATKLGGERCLLAFPMGTSIGRLDSGLLSRCDRQVHLIDRGPPIKEMPLHLHHSAARSLLPDDDPDCFFAVADAMADYAVGQSKTVALLCARPSIKPGSPEPVSGVVMKFDAECEP